MTSFPSGVIFGNDVIPGGVIHGKDVILGGVIHGKDVIPDLIGDLGKENY